MNSSVGEVEKFEESKVLQHLQLILEESYVKLSVAVRSELDELVDEECCITVLVFPHAVLIPTEELHDSLEEV